MATQTMMLCIHIGVICVAGLTFSMIPMAALTYIMVLGLSIQYHIAIHAHEMSHILNAATGLSVVMLCQAFFQNAGQFVARMRRDSDPRHLERKQAHPDNLELDRDGQAERR